MRDQKQQNKDQQKKDQENTEIRINNKIKSWGVVGSRPRIKNIVKLRKLRIGVEDFTAGDYRLKETVMNCSVLAFGFPVTDQISKGRLRHCAGLKIEWGAGWTAAAPPSSIFPVFPFFLSYVLPSRPCFTASFPSFLLFCLSYLFFFLPCFLPSLLPFSFLFFFFVDPPVRRLGRSVFL